MTGGQKAPLRPEAGEPGEIDMTPRVKIIIEQLARMRVAGIRDNVIAAKLGMSQGGLSRILALPEYQECEAAALSGVVSKMDAALAGRADALKQYFSQGVPVALRALVESVTQSRDLRARISAAAEILDRDPDRQFAKGSVRINNDNLAQPISEAHLDSIAASADAVATSVAAVPKEQIN